MWQGGEGGGALKRANTLRCIAFHHLVGLRTARATILSILAIKEHVLPAHGQMAWHYSGSSTTECNLVSLYCTSYT